MFLDNHEVQVLHIIATGDIYREEDHRICVLINKKKKTILSIYEDDSKDVQDAIRDGYELITIKGGEDLRLCGIDANHEKIVKDKEILIDSFFKSIEEDTSLFYELSAKYCHVF